MARRAAALKRERERDPEAILLSAGDFYAESGILAMYRGIFLGQMMTRMGYTAVSPGENDLMYDLRPIREAVSNGLPVICANLYSGGERVFPPYIIRDVRGVRIGIFGLLGEELPRSSNIDLRPPEEECTGIIEELEEKDCDLIILLAHMGGSKLQGLISALDGVGIIIRGHSEGRAEISEDCADRSIDSFQDLGVPVLFAGDRGKLIGKVVLRRLEDSRIAIVDTTLIHLETTSEVDEEFAGYVQEYTGTESGKLREIRMKNFVSRDSKGNIMERYLGPGNCARCHSDISSRFLSSPHRTAFARIENVKNAEKRGCYSCHTTGYGKFSGYGSEEARSSDLDLEGVSCEACHGPGTTHSRKGLYVEAARNSCKTCHTAERSPGFDYDTYMEKVICYMKPDSVSRPTECD